MVVVKVPEDLATLLEGRPDTGAAEQAFPFLTVDDAGYPHVALLSRAELDVRADRAAILAVVASVRTRVNLRRDGRAGLIVIGGTVAHYAKMRVWSLHEDEGVLGSVLEVVGHKRDTFGIPLTPIGFRTTEQVATADDWQRSARLLNDLASKVARAGEAPGS